jgi:hypothetical protein
MHTKTVCLAALLICGLTAGAYAQGGSESVVVLPNEIVWKPAPVSPAQRSPSSMAIHRRPVCMSSE